MILPYYFPMQELVYIDNLLQDNDKCKFVFHFCPPIVPESKKLIVLGQNKGQCGLMRFVPVR